MIWHPLTWAFVIAAATGGLLYAMAAVRAVEVAAEWQPECTDARQLRRERRAENAALLGNWSFGCLWAAALFGLLGIARVWHRLVPGAMCGTGVLQAMGVGGGRALIFWAAALSLLYAWQVLARLDRSDPEAPLTVTGARLLITAAPFLVLALVSAWQALMHVGSTGPVSCCAVVYDQVLRGAGGGSPMAHLVRPALWLSLAGSAVLAAMAMAGRRLSNRQPSIMPVTAAVLWAAASVVAINHVWSAYYYQVLSHPCPWCLFLPQFHSAGFLIFGCLAVVVLESTALSVADGIRRHHPRLAPPARRRMRRAAGRILLALAGFTLLTAGPAILWRLRTGVWLGAAS